MGSLADEVREAAPVLPDHEVERVLQVIDQRLAASLAELRQIKDKVEGQEEGQKPNTVLNEAEGLIRGERLKHYGHPSINFQRIAGSWSEFLGMHITPVMVCMMMIMLKAQRMAEGYHHDSVVDIGGYAALAAVLEGDDEL